MKFTVTLVPWAWLMVSAAASADVWPNDLSRPSSTTIRRRSYILPGPPSTVLPAATTQSEITLYPRDDPSLCSPTCRPNEPPPPYREDWIIFSLTGSRPPATPTPIPDPIPNPIPDPIPDPVQPTVPPVITGNGADKVGFSLAGPALVGFAMLFV
ncbi:hypothetical protein XA68_10442 [Ophiocordyceps unilateralis]|uniref:Uncharacterized protein n=1 Tax=Ophiocordyceps unilateralis TaxID=268505 RepID=A0A2A9PHN9_OPHUN|nr:hypothetical protein XA68_10442 [Ophiocordyceps unilateralis]